MTNLWRATRSGATALAFVAFTACSGAGNLGNILGGVLGGSGTGQGNQNQVSGTVLGIDTRSQQIAIQTSNGQQVNLSFDNQTQVVYQNQSYSVTNLERGDQVTARIQQSNNGGYYTDLVQVDQSASNGGGTYGGGASGNVQAIQGTVQQVDLQNGLFSLNTNQYGQIIVALAYNVSRTDQNRFQNLRRGDNVRLYGVFINNQRVELRQFY